MTNPINNILERLDRVTKTGDGQWEAQCPAHDDGQNSLCVGVGDDGRVLLHCQAGCETKAIIETVGLQMRDLFPPAQDSQPQAQSKVVAEYVYSDETGKAVFGVQRKHPKKFCQFHFDDDGNRVWNMRGVQRVLYHLDELTANPDATVLIVEGEKDADRLRVVGFIATCNAGGADKWQDGYTESLRGRKCVLLADNDDAGRKHVQRLAAALHGVAASVKVVELPDLPAKGDVSDWLNAGNTSDDLKRLVGATSEWVPSDSTTDDEPIPVAITNEVKDGEDSIPVSMADIVSQIEVATDGWPRRAGKALFVHETNGEINWISKTAEFFAFVGRRSGHPARFSKSSHCHTKGEVLGAFQQTAHSYDAVETLPHEPELPGHYYACNDIPPGDGSTMNTLLDKLSPETDIDRDLMLAAFLTTIWGGRSGSRPMFAITSDAGRGTGKTTFAALVGQFAGGLIEIGSNEDGREIKKRLLSPVGLTKRVALIDNLKSSRFSNATLEGLITSPVISGHQMFNGEGERPNNLTWFLTCNGVSLATDLAQRSVIIKLAKPRHSGTWADDTRLFIDGNRAKLIGDCIGILRDEAETLKWFSRRGDWERNVLARLPEPSDAQAVIAERQKAANVEDEEADIVADYFKQQLEDCRYNVAFERVFIPSSVASDWYNAATKEKHGVASVSRKLKQMAAENALPDLCPCPTRSYGRGFVWAGKHSKANDTMLTDIQERLTDRTDRTHSTDTHFRNW